MKKILSSLTGIATMILFTSSIVKPVNKRPHNPFAPDTVTYNIRSFGALGTGLSSLIPDTTAFSDAFDSLRRVPGWKKLYVPTSSSYYCWAGTGLNFPDSIVLYGDDSTSVIRQVNPDLGSGSHGVFAFTCTYSNVVTENMVANVNCSYGIRNASIGDTYVILTTLADTIKIRERLLIGLGGRVCYRGLDTLQSYFSQFELNSIARVSYDTAFLAYPLTVNLTTSPKLIDVNSPNNTIFYGSTHNHIARNVIVRNLKFSQSQVNQLNSDTALSQPITSMIKGGGFECSVHDCVFEGYDSQIDGNMYNRYNIYNNIIYACKKMADFGYGSANDSIYNLMWHFRDSPVKTLDSDNGFMFFDEGTHNMRCLNFTADGDWDQITFMHIANTTSGIFLQNFNFNLPAYNDSTNKGFLLADGDSLALPVRRITLDNITLSLNMTGNFINCTGDSSNGSIPNRGISFSNMFFYGFNDKRAIVKTYFGLVNQNNVNVNNVKQ